MDPKRVRFEDSPAPGTPPAHAAAAAADNKDDDEAEPTAEEVHAVLEDEDDPELTSFRRERERYAENLKLLLDSFTPEQRERHEQYRRTKFKQPEMRKLMQSLTGQTPDKFAVMIMAAIAKVYTGEVVEAALDVQQERGGQGPLQPVDIRGAVQRLKSRPAAPAGNYKHKRLFTR